jgi:leucyl aminopeptidase
MDVIFKKKDIFDDETPILIPVFSSNLKEDKILKKLNQLLDGFIYKIIDDKEYSGKIYDLKIIYTFNKIKPSKVILFGVGDENDFDFENIRRSISETLRTLTNKAIYQVNLINNFNHKKFDFFQTAKVLTETAIISQYSFDKYITKTDDIKEKFHTINFCEIDDSKLPILENAINKGKIYADSVYLAKDISNEPTNQIPPLKFAEIAKQVAKDNDLEFELLDFKDLQKKNLNLIVSVGKGSFNKPCMVTLKYKSKNSDKTIGLVGKGLIFDSGGYSLKPGSGMMNMKFDRCGGANMLAVMKNIAKLKPYFNVTCVIPLSENSIGPEATYPGDVIKSYSGKTVEILNTDAEGRLILADALSYIQEKENLSLIVDIATLTGGCVAALGNKISAILTNSDKFHDVFVKASKLTNEKLWRLPLEKGYKKRVKSKVADIKNITMEQPSTISAALFLEEFIENNTPWVHLDIASTMCSTKTKSYFVKGANASNTRNIMQTLEIINDEKLI